MIRTKNARLLLFVLIGCISCWLGGQFFYRLYHYFQLSLQMPASLKDWSIKEQENGTFRLEITYTFEWKGKMVQRTDPLSKKDYPNPYVAKAVLDRYINHPLTVWLNPKNHQIIALKKTFPLLEGIKALLSLAVFVYFIFLSWFIRKKAL